MPLTQAKHSYSIVRDFLKYIFFKKAKSCLKATLLLQAGFFTAN
jgi:hypothetical protein